MPRFVLLEHRWNGVHWDFMLEPSPGSALRTWAIQSEVVPERDLPAQALADHRPLYLDYEGEISGGRGSVQRIDAGHYEPLVWSEHEVVVRVSGNRLRGVVSLRTSPTGGSADSRDRRSAEGMGRLMGWTFRLGNCD